MFSIHLAEESFNFAPESGNLIQSSPVIFSHSEISGKGTDTTDNLENLLQRTHLRV